MYIYGHYYLSHYNHNNNVCLSLSTDYIHEVNLMMQIIR